MDPNEMHPLQLLVNEMSRKWQQERAGSQMTLGKLIETLKALPQDMLIDGICNPHSYRGYYVDLSFEPDGFPELKKRSVSSILSDCLAAMGTTFQGYKGGDYTMGDRTPVWIAPYGSCGVKITGLDIESGRWLTMPDE